MDAVIRQALPADLPEVERIVRDAYTKYIVRIGKPPGPMLDDYAARIMERTVWIAELEGVIVGLVVLLEKEDHLYLDNIAIDPPRQGEGFGRPLMIFAEDRARRRGYRGIRLVTHRAMHENLALYARAGWTETGRGQQDGYDRVFFSKSL